MIAPQPQTQSHLSLALLELALTVVVCLAAVLLPRLGNPFFTAVERSLARLARRRRLAVAVVGAAGFLLRIAILPIIPVPLPIVPDDFSFLLAADTFAHFRLANPTPAHWQFFESIHISLVPTYQSMYFPGQGLMLAAGQIVFGNPWWAVLITTALFCAALCWMLQAWLPATWAFFGGMLAVLHLGLFSYWGNTFHAGVLIGFAGALVLGAFPRFLRRHHARHAWLLALGISILVLCRPYEGLLLCLPVLAAFLHHAWRAAAAARRLIALRAALPLALVVASVGWLGYYDQQVNGSATTLPYTLNRAQYAVAPYYVWQQARPEPAYHHATMRDFYVNIELPLHTLMHSPATFLPFTLGKFGYTLVFFAGFALLPPLVMFRRVLKDRRIRFLVVSVALLGAGMAIEVYLIPHYVAPFTAAFYAIGLQSMRHFRQLRLSGAPVGRTLSRLLVLVCLVMGGARLAVGPLHIQMVEFPAGAWDFFWYGPGHFGTQRAQAQATVAAHPGKQLAIVRYAATHYSMDEWVYNGADLNGCQLLWARSMGPERDRELIAAYPDRTPWLVEPDNADATVTPYPILKEQP